MVHLPLKQVVPKTKMFQDDIVFSLLFQVEQFGIQLQWLYCIIILITSASTAPTPSIGQLKCVRLPPPTERP